MIFDQLSFLENVISAKRISRKCNFGEISFRSNARSRF